MTQGHFDFDAWTRQIDQIETLGEGELLATQSGEEITPGEVAGVVELMIRLLHFMGKVRQPSVRARAMALASIRSRRKVTSKTIQRWCITAAKMGLVERLVCPGRNSANVYRVRWDVLDNLRPVGVWVSPHNIKPDMAKVKTGHGTSITGHDDHPIMADPLRVPSKATPVSRLSGARFTEEQLDIANDTRDRINQHVGIGDDAARDIEFVNKVSLMVANGMMPQDWIEQAIEAFARKDARAGAEFGYFVSCIRNKFRGAGVEFGQEITKITVPKSFLCSVGGVGGSP